MSEHTADADAPKNRMVTIRYRSPGGRWLTRTGELVPCVCDQTTSRLTECPAHPAHVIPPDETERDRQQPWHPASRGWVG